MFEVHNGKTEEKVFLFLNKDYSDGGINIDIVTGDGRLVKTLLSLSEDGDIVVFKYEKSGLVGGRFDYSGLDKLLTEPNITVLDVE